MKTIALIDPFWSGHHPMYLKLFSKALLSLGHNVMVFCANPKTIQSWIDEKSAEHRDMLHCFEIHEPKQSTFPLPLLKPVLYALKLWNSADKAIQEAMSQTGYYPDLVFFPWLDTYSTHFQSHYLIDRLFTHEWSGLLFHPYHLRLRLRFSAFRRGPLDLNESLKSMRCKAIAVLDEGVVRTLQETLIDKSVVIFPDVTDESAPDHDFPILNNIASRAKGAKIITLMGSLGKRKGMFTLIEVAQKATGRDWFFVFAGRLDEKSFARDDLLTLRRLAADPPENCFFYFELIPGEAQFNALVEISDVLFAVYDKFPHSSNILTKAAVFRKPVIVNKGYCMAERVRDFNMGESVDYGDVRQCTEAIRRLCEGSKLGADFEKYKQLHSAERLSVAFAAIIGCY